MVRSEAFPCNAVNWVFQAVSGAAAAVTAEVTAVVTSRPSLDEPVKAWMIELMSMPEDELEVPRRELSAEEIELMGVIPFLGVGSIQLARG
jgi:hypothetical protein